MAVTGKSRFALSTVLINIGVAALIAFSILPLIWTAYTSVRPELEIIKFPAGLMFGDLGFDAYREVLRYTDFPLLLGNSVIVSLMTMVMSLTLGTFAGYALSRANFGGKQGILLFYMLVRVIPGVLLLIPIYILMQKLNLLDTKFGLALAYTTFTLPAAIWLMKGFFDALPVDLENAARIDGCSRMGAMWRIVLPLVRPGMAATGTLVAIEAWNDVLFALMITSTNEARTWPVGMKLLIGEFQLPWAQLTATAMMSVIPVLIAFGLAGRKMALNPGPSQGISRMPLFVSAKSGTAQYGVRDYLGRLPYHNWMGGFVAPTNDWSKDDSEFAYVVFMHGTNTAGNAAKEVTKYYLQLQFDLKRDYRTPALLARGNFFGE